MALKFIDELSYEGKKVIARFDFNVPLSKDGTRTITDTTRIDMALPTIQYILNNGASKLVMMSHLGRPKGQRKTEFPTREFDIPLEGRIPYDFRKIPEGAKVFNSEIGEDEAIEMAKQQIINDHNFLAKQDADRIIDLETKFKVGDAYYLHAPVWIMRYKYKRKNYITKTRKQ